MLADSLRKLMVTKPLSKISIREITEDCGVNRQTFYYHFHDIFDLLEWMFIEGRPMDHGAIADVCYKYFFEGFFK